MPKYDVLTYQAIATDTSIDIGAPADALGLRLADQHVCGIYPGLHEGSDGTIVLAATPDNRPVLGLEQLLLPHGPEYVVMKARGVGSFVDEALPLEPGHPAYRRHPEPFAAKFS